MRCYPNFSLPMGRSLGFASAPADCAPCSDSLSLRLRASLRLASPATATRRFIMQKARRHGTRPLRPLVGTWFQVLLHSPVRGSFHLSLTVLFAIGLSVVFSLAGWSPRIRPEFLVLRVTQVPARLRPTVSLTGLLPSTAPLSSGFRYRRPDASSPVLLPREARRHARGLGSSAFARHYSRNHSYFLLLRVLRCFSSPRSPALRAWPALGGPGCPIRISADRFVFADPRGFSQLVASFFASESLGIHRAPFVVHVR